MNERRITVAKKYDTEGSNAQAKTKMQQSRFAGEKIVETFIYCKLYNCIQFDCIMNATQATGLLSK